jgi:quinolinate synthase
MELAEIQIPQEYLSLGEPELCRRVAAAKARLGENLCILGHHYQRDEVVQFADFVGDSLKLSQQAATQKRAKYIIFCGVHFMAESADVLTAPEQAVILPNLNAGCAMADLADEAEVAAALEELAALGAGKLLPVVYVNSTAGVKDLAARAGGACCTSSNAREVFEWALSPAGAGGERVLAVPDQHLARNSAVAMGYRLDQCAVHDPAKLGGGLTREGVEHAKFILWKGQCHIHQVFRPAHIEAVRRRYPGIFVIVHPECPREVVLRADGNGSTSYLVKLCEQAPAGATLVIGTEINLVLRMQQEHPRLTVQPLARSLCPNLYRINLENVAQVLRDLHAGRGGDGHRQRISVADDVRRDAQTALQRMLQTP